MSSRPLLIAALFCLFALASCSESTAGPEAEPGIGSEGGTVQSTGGEAVLAVPPGALDAPVEITVVSATYEQVRARVEAILGSTTPSLTPPATTPAAAAEVGPSKTDHLLPLLAGRIQPIAGTFWDFGPDGLRFLSPATVTLTYRDEDLPPEVSEEELGVFVINGVIPFERVGVVDPVANTVTAPVDHFSFFFVGYLVEPAVEGVDLAVTALELSPTEVVAGTPISVSAVLQNFGADPASLPTVRYRTDGSVGIGSLGQGCLLGDGGEELEVQCALLEIGGQSSAALPEVELVPSAPGSFTVTAEAVHEADAFPDNNALAADFTVVIPSADLRVDRLVDAPDPVEPGGVVTYEIDVVADGGGTIEGARLLLEFTGDADFSSATVTCTTPNTGAWICPLGPLSDGVVQTVEVAVVLTTAGSTVTLNATIEPPFGPFEDPDADNNSRGATTTVAGSSVVPIAYGDVVERALPEGGSAVTFPFDGIASELARIGVAMISGPNPTGDIVVTSPAGDTIVGGGPVPVRADELQSENLMLTLPASGTYELIVRSFGSGSFRVGLGRGIGRGDIDFGDFGRPYVRIPGTSQSEEYFLDFDMVGDEIVAMGSRHLTRLDDFGQLVPGFGTGGEVDLEPVFYGRASAFAVQPDGRIVVAALAGPSPYPWGIARFLADGSLDDTFGSGGIVQIQLGSGAGSQEVKPLAIGFQQNGPELDIVVAGHSASDSERIGIVRLNPDGSVDAAFGNAGTVLADGGFIPSNAAVQPDGAILVGSDAQLRRFTAAGAADVGFGTAGLVTFTTPGVVSVIPLAGGDIVGVGESNDDALVVRLTAGGAPATFGSGGSVVLDFGAPERLQDVVEDSEGRLLLTGYERTPGGRYDQLLVRLSAGGELDSSFGHGGFTIEGLIDDGRAVLFDGEGRILVGGQGRSAFGLHISRHLMN